MQEILKDYIFIYLGTLNIITFALYGVDKLKAKYHRWRISEKALLGLGLIGGFLGALMGMQLFRHKTKHFYFYAVNVISAVLWVYIICRILI